MTSTVMVRPERQASVGKGNDALQEPPLGRLAAIGKEAHKRFRRPDDDKLADMEHACRPHSVKADRHAGDGVPEQLRRSVNESRKPDGRRRENVVSTYPKGVIARSSGFEPGRVAPTQIGAR
jgi:hypothetical protein